MTEDSGFVHRFVSAPDVSAAATLLLLHGTGGDENDLLPLGELLAAGTQVNLLGVRGKVLERGMPRFFRRFHEGAFDEEDVVRRAGELAEFVGEVAARYGFNSNRIVAVGYSNGANIAAAVMLLHPTTFAAAVLLHSQPVLSDPPVARLDERKVFLTGGRADPIVPASETERLAELLRDAGATVKLAWQPDGHALTSVEVQEARTWLSAQGLLASPKGSEQ